MERRPWVIAAAVALGALCLTARQAPALINPNFTPIHLVTQSDQIVSLEVSLAGGDTRLAARVLSCPKGKALGKPPVIDFSKAAKPQAEAFAKIVGGSGKKLAILFCGRYREQSDPSAGGEEGGAQAESAGFLHVEGAWFRLFRKDAGSPWLLDVKDEHMQGAWAGGTDMLLRAVQYVLKDPDPYVPVRTGATWADKVKVAKLDGKVHGVMAVDLSAGAAGAASAPGAPGPLCLHVLCEAGDRIVRWDKARKAFLAVDAAAELNLTTKSHLAAWADFDGDGRLDLASWDGKALTLCYGEGPPAAIRRGGDPWASGKFAAPVAVQCKLPAAVLGLAVLDVGAAGRPGILVSTAGIPTLLVPEGKARSASGFTAKPLVAPTAGAGEFPGAALGRAHACLVADLDGDHVADVLQPLAKGALFYKGVQAGAFEPPRVCQGIGTGDGQAGAFLGDYDADGLLDVFVAAEERCFLWQNLGGGKFEESLWLAGEAAYISKPNGIGGATGDVNNDGRQDVLILYDNRAPQIFFNRGFRSFGHSHMLDLAEKQLLPDSEKGQQAGTLADLDGDGGQDMAIVLANGELWVFLRDVQDAPALCVRVGLRVGHGHVGQKALTGPITVTGWSESRPLGAWNVVAGTSEAFFGLFEPGTCRVRWQLPGQGTMPKKAKETQEKRVSVERGPVRLLLTP